MPRGALRVNIRWTRDWQWNQTRIFFFLKIDFDNVNQLHTNCYNLNQLKYNIVNGWGENDKSAVYDEFDL